MDIFCLVPKAFPINSLESLLELQRITFGGGGDAGFLITFVTIFQGGNSLASTASVRGSKLAVALWLRSTNKENDIFTIKIADPKNYIYDTILCQLIVSL